jgi:sortase A
MIHFLKKVVPLTFIMFGFVLLLYPFISEYLFENRIDSEIVTYENSAMMEEAKEYNRILMEAKVTLTDPFQEDKYIDTNKTGYNDLLAVDDTGVMAYIEIPVISVYLPVYHGTSAAVLENGIGHLEGSSLPIGDIDSHAVLTGHTGLNRAKLFSDLTELKEGDLFFVHVMGEVLAYQVCSIDIVLPENTSGLAIQKGKDLVTLVTCTPYGVNTHRLMVTGERVAYSEEVYQSAQETGGSAANSQWMRAYKQAIVFGIAVSMAAFLVVMIFKKKNKVFIGLVMILIGLLIFFSPSIKNQVQTIEIQQFVKNYDAMYETTETDIADAFYQNIEAYNQSLYDTGQDDLTDPWQYEQTAEPLTNMGDEAFGYIEIPAMDQILPLYSGASSANMARGAAVLGETSLPIGGLNTNSVIAGHRGYDGKAFFKEIEKLQIGDNVYITNPWEKLTYSVTDIQIIDPCDVEAIKIQAERDMITLMTCHPYASGGKYRYLVYCDRIVAASEQVADSDVVDSVDTKMYVSSGYEVDEENLFRKLCLGLIILLAGGCIIHGKMKEKKQRE